VRAACRRRLLGAKNEDSESEEEDGDHDYDTNLLRGAVGMKGETFQDRRRTADDGSPQLISKPWFNRTFQPYDWYVKTETEVGPCWVLRVFEFAQSTLTNPTFETVLLSLRRIHA